MSIFKPLIKAGKVSAIKSAKVAPPVGATGVDETKELRQYQASMLKGVLASPISKHLTRDGKRLNLPPLRELVQKQDKQGVLDALRNVQGSLFDKKGGGEGAIPLLEEALTKPMWQHSGREIKIVNMSPASYLRKTAEGLGFGFEEFIGSLRDDPRTQRILQGMLEGKKFQLPHLDYRNQNFGQEGNHRAFAAALLGKDKIPVAVIWNAKGRVPKSLKQEMAGTSAAAVGLSQTNSAEAAGDQVDWSFIAEREGNKSWVYVPQNKKGEVLGKSGPTIGMGIDLGAWGEKDLRSVGVSENIIKKLKPYFGKKGKSAKDFVFNNSLKLDETEVEEINKAVKGKLLQRLVSNFNKESKIPFDQLTSGQQTAVASVFFQYGPEKKTDPKDGWPINFWNQVTSGDWAKAKENLLNFGDKYPSRRKAEAKLL